MKCSVRVWFALAYSLLLSGAAYSQDAPGSDSGTYSKEFDACTYKWGGYESRMVECLEQEIARQDKLLNLAYRQLLARPDGVATADLPGVAKARLQKAERAWMAFRDAQCEYVYVRNGADTVARVSFGECRLAFAIERLKALQGFLAREDERGL